MKPRQTQLAATLAIEVAWAWSVMTVTHEIGHVVAGLLGGATLVQLELRPWHLPHSQLIGDARPWVTIWAGPFLGSLGPLLAATFLRRRAVWLMAWFCLLANGLYLLLGLFSDGAELDTNKLIRAGTPTVVVATIAALATGIGYWKFRGSCIDLLESEPIHLTQPIVAWILLNGLLSFAVMN
jgi:hypothetical protein